MNCVWTESRLENTMPVRASDFSELEIKYGVSMSNNSFERLVQWNETKANRAIVIQLSFSSNVKQHDSVDTKTKI